MSKRNPEDTDANILLCLIVFVVSCGLATLVGQIVIWFGSR